MSRIGKKPILIPNNVEVKIDSETVKVKGPKGELSFKVRSEIKAEVKDGKVLISPQLEISKQTAGKSKKTRSLWGLTRALISNMVNGVTQGYEKKLQIEGIGYKAALEGDTLVLNVGFTQPTKVKAPQGIKFLVEKNIVTISGIDKELVGLTAARIKKVRPPEPYKGKGIRYLGEFVRKKVGKKAVSAGT